MPGEMKNNTISALKLEMVIIYNTVNKTQQIYTVLTGRLSELKVLLLENKNSELLHPGWRGPVLASQKPLQKRGWNN